MTDKMPHQTTLPTWAYISWKPRAGYSRCVDPACRYQHKEHYHEASVVLDELARLSQEMGGYE